MGGRESRPSLFCPFLLHFASAKCEDQSDRRRKDKQEVFVSFHSHYPCTGSVHCSREVGALSASLSAGPSIRLPWLSMHP